MPITNKDDHSSFLLENVDGNEIQTKGEITPLTENTAKNAMNLIQSPVSTNESVEFSEEALFAKLDLLWEELKDALALYKEISNEDFGGVEGSYADIEYPINPERTALLNTENVQANAIFSNIKIDDRDEIAFYNELLTKLKAKEVIIQVQLLCLIDYANVFIAKYFDGRVGSEFNKGYKDPLGLEIASQSFYSSYKEFVKKIFDSYDLNPGEMLAMINTIDWKSVYKTK